MAAVRNDRTAKHHTHITKIPPEILCAEQVASAYRGRWLNELLFKELKTGYRIGGMPIVRKEVAEAFLYPDRRKAGSKQHLIADALGIPLAGILTAANINDVTQLIPLIDAIPSFGGQVGRPRHKPDIVQGDRGHDSEAHQRELRSRGIQPVIAKRRIEHGSGLGVTLWVI
jgi:hypothetical protein